MLSCMSNIKINYMIYIASPYVFPGEKDMFISLNAGRCWSKTGLCHILFNIEQILFKFQTLVYSMTILQIVNVDLICIMVAMVTDKS